jgi:hypothetical protein
LLPGFLGLLKDELGPYGEPQAPQEQMMSSFPKPPVRDPHAVGFQAGFETMMTKMRFAMATFAIAISAMFA